MSVTPRPSQRPLPQASQGSFVITTSTGKRKADATQSRVWDGHAPMPIGHPFRWVIERDGDGLRLRDLSTRPGEIVKDAIHRISADMIAQGASIPLPDASNMILTVRPADLLQAAFVQKGLPDKDDPQAVAVRVHACAGNWVLESLALGERYVAFAHGQKAFTLEAKGDEYRLNAHVPGVLLSLGEPQQPRAAEVGQAYCIPRDRVAAATLTFASLSWRFTEVVDQAVPTVRGSAIDAESAWFKKSIRYTAVAFGAFLVMTLLWPKAKQEELLPEQFAKIVLAKPPKPSAPAAQSTGATPAKSAATQTQQKIEKAAVVQAFRAKALNNAVSGLLKGGMTSLLAQSDFVTGNAATADARKLFDSKSKALSAGQTGPAAAHDVKVATMGGAASAKNAGYAKGERAAVQGQGKAFVSMDIADAAVEEGLTKDEVGEVIHRHASEIRYCYESAMLRTPDIEGKLAVLFTIGPNGLVKSTAVKSSTLPDPRLEDCVLRRLTSWKFPLPKGGVDVPVTYPFVFKTLGR